MSAELTVAQRQQLQQCDEINLCSACYALLMYFSCHTILTAMLGSPYVSVPQLWGQKGTQKFNYPTLGLLEGPLGNVWEGEVLSVG